MNVFWKILVVCLLAAALAGVLVLKKGGPQTPAVAADEAAPSQETKTLPRLVELGAETCIPCKAMKPVLDGLRKDFAGRLKVEFIDVWKDPKAAEPFKIRVIPTQVFLDASGKELFRHEGFFGREDILATFKERGVVLAQERRMIVREEPKVADERPAEKVCAMCTGDVADSTRVDIPTSAEPVRFCSPHCFFIFYSSLLKTDGVEERTLVTDASTGKPVAATTATYVWGSDKRGRPRVKAFAGKAAAQEEMKKNGGQLADYTALKEKELSVRCGFCDRVCYPQDSARVKVEGIRLYACCPMCALGVAARLQKDIEVAVKDDHTGEAVRVTTLNGSVRSLEPETTLAWHGQKRNAEGKMVSGGCFKQFFFVGEESLKKWLEAHPEATGREMTIQKALTAKMKLTPRQIRNACKTGECP